LITRVVTIAIVELLCPFSSPGRTCKPKCWWFFFFLHPFNKALQKFLMCFVHVWAPMFLKNWGLFWIAKFHSNFKVWNYLHRYPRVFFFSASDFFFGSCWWRMRVLMELQNLQVLLTFVFSIWHVGVWDEWARVKMPIVWWGKF
jgi:hypothetical protein